MASDSASFGTPANMRRILDDSFEGATKGDFEFHGLVTDQLFTIHVGLMLNAEYQCDHFGQD